MSKTVTLDWSSFRNAVKAAIIVCSDGDSQISLESILFEVSSGKLRIVATDGHRMLQIEMIANTDDSELFSFLLNRTDMIAWVKIAPPKKGIDSSVEITVTSERAKGEPGFNGHTYDFVPDVISIKTPVATCELKTVDAQFPPCDQVIPVRAVADLPEGKRAMPLVCGFNAGYLADLGAIAKLVGDNKQAATIELPTEELGPIRFDIQNSKQQIASIYVLMTMRTK